MALITNIQHFMNGNVEADDLPAEALALLNFLTTVIERVTEDYDEAHPASTVSACRDDCDGDVVAWVSREDDLIHWRCTDCDDEVMITHWEGTKWDRRDITKH